MLLRIIASTRSTALSLVEVKVYGRDCPDCTVKSSAVPSFLPPPTTPRANTALLKPTSQSTTDYGGESSKAVDGNTDGRWGGASVTHTGRVNGNSWRVNLEGAFIIDNIILYHHRTDYCTWRNRGHMVTIFVKKRWYSPTSIHGKLLMM